MGKYIDVSQAEEIRTDEWRFWLMGKLYTYKAYQWAKFTEAYTSDSDGVWVRPWDEFRVNSYMPLNTQDPELGIHQFFQNFGNSTLPKEL